MTFEEYLVKKRINREVFAAEDPGRYKAWESMYAQMHPNSFYVAVKMVLNNVRLRYHLREEDVPKPAPTTAPRPAARRAVAPAGSTEAVPPAAIPENPAAIPAPASAMPAATDVPQETTEEKQVAPVTSAKPRPVVRRPAALQKPTTEDEAATEKPAEGTAPAAPRARPVIKRPVIAKPDTETPAGEAAPAQQEPATPRPRPVIKRPAALAKPAEEPTDAQAQEGQAKVEQVIPEAAKPARPRPVIKRPAALQKPTQAPDSPAEESTASSSGSIESATGMAPASNAETTAPKPPRPRPIIKRVAALQKPAEDAATPSDNDKAAPGEEAIAEAPTASGSITPPDKDIMPESGIASETAAGPKPPRPRPVIKRPTALQKPEQEAVAEDKPSVSGEPVNSESTGSSEEPASEKPKPPRPRPVIKRPAALVQPKTEQTNEVDAIPEQASPETPKEQSEATASDDAKPTAMSPDTETGIADVPPAGESAMPEEQKPKPPRPRPVMRRPPPKTEE
jgi:hypothetical protein